MNLDQALWQDPGRVSGAVCFRGTRIPVSILFDHLEVGQLDQFKEGFPDVTLEQIRAVIEGSQTLINERFGVPAWIDDSRHQDP